MAEHEPANLAESLNNLTPKTKTPASARVLSAWIAQAQSLFGTVGPRLGWLVAATVVSAALQRAVDDHGSPLFLLKGGTMLQYRLPGMSRTTKDIDGLVRGDLDRFLTELDIALAEPWGPLTLARDVVDLLLLRDLIETTQRPTLSEVRAAVEDIFMTRAAEANATGATPRNWPTRCIAHPHWESSFTSAAESAGVATSLTDSVDQLNDWFDLIEHV